MYQKFQATQIFTGTELSEDQLVLITTKDGTIEGLVGIEDAGEDIQRHNLTGWVENGRTAQILQWHLF